MALNNGKKFEMLLKKDWLKTIPDSSIDRIYDSQSGYYKISNIADFVAYKYPNLFYLEAKTHKGNTFPFINLTQYDKLLSKVGIKGIRTGVVIWFEDHDRILYIPISTIKKMKHDDKKSVNIKTIDIDGYKYYNIPVEKKRVYLEADYSILLTTLEGE